MSVFSTFVDSSIVTYLTCIARRAIQVLKLRNFYRMHTQIKPNVRSCENKKLFKITT